MQTLILSQQQIPYAAQLLAQGQCVAFPTETVYGLGANALDPQAVAKIYQAKGRPADNPLIVHCHSLAQVRQVVAGWTPEARILMDEFWPGPLTLVLDKRPQIPASVSGGLSTVAVRMPNHPIALHLIETAGLPVAAPSANISGKPSPTRASHVLDDLQGKIPAIIDGGTTGWGLESTVVDCTSTPFRLLRPGGVTSEQIRQLVDIEVTGDLDDRSPPPSPGMKYKHYSPAARVVLVVGKHIPTAVAAQVKKHAAQGLRVGVMAASGQQYPPAMPFDLGGDLASMAANIFHLLRQADQQKLDVVVIEGVEPLHLGQAIMNRLTSAADEIIST